MSEDLLGQTAALLAAVTWAASLILFKISGETVPPFALNLFKNVVALVVMTATLCFRPDGLDALSAFQWQDHVLMMLSGFLGITLADTAFLFALHKMGVGLVTIVECLYSPLVVLFAFLLIGETLNSLEIAGAGCVLAAVFVSSRHAPPPNRTRFDVLQGFVLGAISIALMAIGIVMAKPVLDFLDFPLIWATFLRLIAGTVALALLAAASPRWRSSFRVFIPAPVWRYSIPAAVLGTYFAMIFWVAGFKYTDASIAAILNQTSVMFALVFAAIVLREPFTVRKGLAVGLAFGGVVLVTFSERLVLLL